MKSKILATSSFAFVFTFIFKKPIFAIEENAFGQRSRLAISLLIAYVLMMACLVIVIKTKKKLNKIKQTKKKKN